MQIKWETNQRVRSNLSFGIMYDDDEMSRDGAK